MYNTCTLMMDPEEYPDGHQDGFTASLFAHFANHFANDEEYLKWVLEQAHQNDVYIEENPLIGWKYDCITKEKAYDIYAYEANGEW